MPEDFSLYDFVQSLSLFGWVIVIAAMTGIIYLLAKGTEMLVMKKCPYCGKRVPKRLTTCNFCNGERI